MSVISSVNANLQDSDKVNGIIRAAGGSHISMRGYFMSVISSMNANLQDSDNVNGNMRAVHRSSMVVTSACVAASCLSLAQ
jgi:hypothetical protein